MPKPEEPVKLTIKQQRFVDFYDGNGVAAARAAGYKGKETVLKSVASENLSKPYIKAAIQKREQKRTQGKILTRLERQEFWSNMIKTAEKDSDKLKASELLGRSEADFTDNVKADMGENLMGIVSKILSGKK